METARIDARAVVKVVATAVLVIAAALLLALMLLHTQTTLRWVAAAIFLALALAPAVDAAERLRTRGRGLPRWAAILAVYLLFAVFLGLVVLHVIPPIIREVEALGTQLPGYVSDFERWAERSSAFQSLNDRHDITQTLSEQARSLPSRLGDAAGAAGGITVKLAQNLFAAITVLALAFFLILDRGKLYLGSVERLPGEAAERWQRIGHGIYRVVKSYVSVTLLSAAMAGVFTWLVLEALGVPMAVPLAVLVAFLDLIPLIGFTLGGLLVAIAAGISDFPTAAVIWIVLFLVYQQIQDRVFQPLLFRSAVHLNPAVAIVAVLLGAEMLGILGALIAIPVAGSIGVIAGELLPRRPRDTAPGPPAPLAEAGGGAG